MKIGTSAFIFIIIYIFLEDLEIMNPQFTFAMSLVIKKINKKKTYFKKKNKLKELLDIF
jgi:hypothetical protein